MIQAALAKLPAAYWLLIGLIVFVGIASAVLRIKGTKRSRWKREPIFFRPKAASDADPWPKNEEPDFAWQRMNEPSHNSKEVDTSKWSLELLQALEWRRLELLCAGYFEALGFKAKNNTFGPDGGIDIHLYAEGQDQPAIVVQCKAWKNVPVGVDKVRELYGVMARNKIPEGIFVTTGTYTAAAQTFPTSNDLHLVDGRNFVEKLLALANEQQEELLAKATEGDFTTPTCASCGIKMISRTPRRGGNSFWGCANYPRCKQMLQQPAERERK